MLARKLVRLGDPRTAYVVASQHGQTLAGEPRQDAEFLAGFIALRLLDDKARALPHFQRVGEGSRSAITQGPAPPIWQGMAESDPGRARAAYQRAAGFPVAFYGQMGLAGARRERRAAFRAGSTPSAVPRPGEAEARAFLDRELPRLILALGDLGEARRARPLPDAP